MKNAIILVLMFLLFAMVSEMDYQDSLLAQGKQHAECETGKPTPDTTERADT